MRVLMTMLISVIGHKIRTGQANDINSVMREFNCLCWNYRLQTIVE